MFQFLSSSFGLVSFGLVWFCLVSFYLVSFYWFRFGWFRFIWFRFIWFRFANYSRPEEANFKANFLFFTSLSTAEAHGFEVKFFGLYGTVGFNAIRDFSL